VGSNPIPSASESLALDLVADAQRYTIGISRLVTPGLIHGARSALCRAERRSDRRSIWASKLKLARGFNVAAVALANKNACMLWALLTRGENYRPAAIPDQASKAERTAAFHHRPPTSGRRVVAESSLIKRI
jgi:hypothetical protein